jgi:hypothetical protein
MANLSNFDESGKQCIGKQVLQSMEGREVRNDTSVTSSVTSTSSITQQEMLRGHGCMCGLVGGVILIDDVVVLAAGTPLKHAIPVSM